MPKQKPHKGLSKRVKITATGKVKYKRPCGGHLMRTKNAKRRRRISGFGIMNKTMAKTVKRKLGAKIT